MALAHLFAIIRMTVCCSRVMCRLFSTCVMSIDVPKIPRIMRNSDAARPHIVWDSSLPYPYGASDHSARHTKASQLVRA